MWQTRKTDPADIAYDRYEAALLDGVDLLDPDTTWAGYELPTTAPAIVGALEVF